MTDDELMAQIADGDQQAFSKLFTRWNESVIYFVYRRVRSRHGAEDLAQEVWACVFKHRSSYVANGNFSGWIYRIAKNEVIDHHRRNKKYSTTCSIDRSAEFDNADDFLDRYLSATGDTVDRAITAEEMTRVEEVLPTLPIDQQQAFSLYVFAMMSLPEIAVMMECGLSTVKSRVRLAREKIRLALGIVQPESSNQELDMPATLMVNA